MCMALTQMTPLNYAATKTMSPLKFFVRGLRGKRQRQQRISTLRLYL